MIDDIDHIKALRARVLNKRTLLEAKQKQEKETLELKHRQELEDFEDLVNSLEKAITFLDGEPSTPSITTSYRSGLATAIREILKSHNGKDGDVVDLSYLYRKLRDQNLQVSSQSVYQALRREATKQVLIIFVKGQGFFLARDEDKNAP